jgi:hypothetical protein
MSKMEQYRGIMKKNSEKKININEMPHSFHKRTVTELTEEIKEHFKPKQMPSKFIPDPLKGIKKMYPLHKPTETEKGFHRKSVSTVQKEFGSTSGKASEMLAQLTAKYSGSYLKSKPGQHIENSKKAVTLIHDPSDSQFSLSDLLHNNNDSHQKSITKPSTLLYDSTFNRPIESREKETESNSSNSA